MIGFNISCKGLDSLLKLCSLRGKNISGKDKEAIDSFIIDVEEKRAKISIVESSGSVAMIVAINTSKIFGVGKIPVSISDFKSVLSRFKANDTISVLFDETGQNVTIIRNSPELSFTFNSISSSAVSSTLTRIFPIIFDGEIPKYYVKNDEVVIMDKKYSVRFDIQHSSLNDLIKDGEITGLNFYPISFNTRDNKLICSSVNNKKGNTVKREIEYDSFKVYDNVKDINLKFGSSLTNVINGLDGKVRLYLGEEMHLFIIMENGDFSANIILSEAILDQNIDEEIGV